MKTVTKKGQTWETGSERRIKGVGEKCESLS